MLKESLSVRHYAREMCSHQHSYNQLVLPLNGYLDIEVANFKGKVGVGQGIVIIADHLHAFRAHENARFIVADLNALPSNLLALTVPLFSLTEPMVHFLSFIEKQLHSEINESLEHHTLTLFKSLLAVQSGLQTFDKRIERAIVLMKQELSSPLQIKQLAAVACLSATQFKLLFKQQVGSSPHRYLTQLRMEKAKALLRHTDMPIQLIAQQVGYFDHSAFTRRFSLSFGYTPHIYTQSA
ncbi:Transcriptional regulator, AraC family [Pseudoalteromonas luteoviolacea B = ATCC 29581]|nr:Transcriptional regulator, AraC family [Pseudoalteromonas luteoviolacea B = ATCC 29581]